mmetsp:Transcript_34073/g.70861  ORF Transcript_34073/g.70861 Transcript_34073/m.70861 type:complete len:203 (-) Transcript_34073:768-1376(-)
MLCHILLRLLLPWHLDPLLPIELSPRPPWPPFVSFWFGTRGNDHPALHLIAPARPDHQVLLELSRNIHFVKRLLQSFVCGDPIPTVFPPIATPDLSACPRTYLLIGFVSLAYLFEWMEDPKVGYSWRTMVWPFSSEQRNPKFRWMAFPAYPEPSAIVLVPSYRQTEVSPESTPPKCTPHSKHLLQVRIDLPRVESQEVGTKV